MTPNSASVTIHPAILHTMNNRPSKVPPVAAAARMRSSSGKRTASQITPLAMTMASAKAVQRVCQMPTFSRFASAIPVTVTAVPNTAVKMMSVKRISRTANIRRMVFRAANARALQTPVRAKFPNHKTAQTIWIVLSNGIATWIRSSARKSGPR